MKKFIITIDTEGDNLWNWREGDTITTKNVYSLQRFQDLCNRYKFKPVWLSNWEMVQNDDFVAFIKENLQKNTCELGMHLHAWNTPPIVQLPRNDTSGAPYLIEYPSEIMEEKIKNMTGLIEQKFGFIPVSHRAGRWAMNGEYFRLLAKYGYKIDCSYTPGISWEKNKGQTPGFGGVNYKKVNPKPQMIGTILEVPVTIGITRRIIMPNNISVKNILKVFYHAAVGQTVWLRPNGYNLKEMLRLVDVCLASETDYMMFMLHSSELMAGENPTFTCESDIELLYEHLNILFEKLSNEGYQGCTLEEYYNIFKEDRKLNG